MNVSPAGTAKVFQRYTLCFAGVAVTGEKEAS